MPGVVVRGVNNPGLVEMNPIKLPASIAGIFDFTNILSVYKGLILGADVFDTPETFPSSK